MCVCAITYHQVESIKLNFLFASVVTFDMSQGRSEVFPIRYLAGKSLNEVVRRARIAR